MDSNKQNLINKILYRAQYRGTKEMDIFVSKFELFRLGFWPLIINDITGSIHQVGAKIQGLPSCNGWDFWHLKDKKSNILLDEIRGNYRDKKSIS